MFVALCYCNEEFLPWQTLISLILHPDLFTWNWSCFSCVGHPFLFQELSEPTDKRILVLAGALHANYDIDRLYELTKIDKWFLQKFKNITELDKILQQFRGKVRNRTHNIALCN